MGGIELLFEMVGKTTGKRTQKKTTDGEYLMNKTLTSSLLSCPQLELQTHAEGSLKITSRMPYHPANSPPHLEIARLL